MKKNPLKYDKNDQKKVLTVLLQLEVVGMNNNTTHL